MHKINQPCNLFWTGLCIYVYKGQIQLQSENVISKLKIESYHALINIEVGE